MRLSLFLLVVALGPTRVWAGPSPCGLKGTLKSRIQDCHTESPVYRVVTVDNSGNTWLQDKKTGLVWVQKSAQPLLAKPAAALCAKPYRIPTQSEARKAAKNGVFSALNPEPQTFWTQNHFIFDHSASREFDINSTTAQSVDADAAMPVVCVGDLADWYLMDDPGI